MENIVTAEEIEESLDLTQETNCSFAGTDACDDCFEADCPDLNIIADIRN